MKLYLPCLLLCACFSLGAIHKDPDAIGILKSMHQRYYHGPCKAYTFSQKNTHYRNDSVIGHSEWHEAVEFPDKFSIHFGERSAGNYVVFKRDSVFSYKGSRQVKSRADSSSLLLLLGGMYYRDIHDVLARLKMAHYNLELASEQEWEGRPVFVIGAAAGDMQANQVWIDKKDERVLRIIEKGPKGVTDMRFESHQAMCKGFVETKVSFRRDGKLEQVEEYYDIKTVTAFQE